MELTPQDAGRKCTLRVGQSVTVELPENPTTGYRWHHDVDAAALEPADDRYDGPQDPRGAGGTRRLTFTALRSGQTRLRLVKKRSWEASGIEEFEVALDVRD